MVQTLETLYRYLRQQLQPVTRSPEQASAEASMIMESVLGFSPEDVYRVGNQVINDSQCQALEDLLHHRVHKRIPIQYLLHEAWFFGLKFYVNPHVLIPRPETELLVEEVLKLARPGMRLVDIGTGPGAIALALASKLGDSVTLVATDLSKEALRVAQINQKSLGTRVELRQGDLFQPVAGERFDIIVSNPPYIDQALRPVLDAEVAWHEPEVALFSPTDDPYHYYRLLAVQGRTHLSPDGHVLVEMGAGMAGEVRNIFETEGYRDLRIIPDLGKIDRILHASLP